MTAIIIILLLIILFFVVGGRFNFGKWTIRSCASLMEEDNCDFLKQRDCGSLGSFTPDITAEQCQTTQDVRKATHENIRDIESNIKAQKTSITIQEKMLDEAIGYYNEDDKQPSVLNFPLIKTGEKEDDLS